MQVTRLFLTLSVSAWLLAGCGPDPASQAPSFATDIRPLLLARCVRCHGGGGMLNGDPPGSLVPGKPPNGYFDHYEDQGDCVLDDAGALPIGCKRGAAYFAAQMKLYVHLPGLSRMPPPPSPALNERELKLIDAWVAEPVPAP